MSRAKKPAASAATVTGCTIIAQPSVANEHSRTAVVALAEACKANAEAISRAADALKGDGGRINTGINIVSGERS